MIFTKNPIPQSIEIPFNWVVDYYDGNYLSEYDFITNKKNSFYAINQSETIRFGLIGQRMKFYFENSDGSFHLNGRRIDIVYEIDGNQFSLTNNVNKKDFITYKQAYTDFNQKSGIQKSNIHSINFGYKTNFMYDDIEFNFQPIVSLPFGESANMQIKLCSNKTLNGYLVFLSSGKEIERYLAPLERGISGQINWTIK